MARIELTDTTMDALIKMVDGNPGAIQALMEIMAKHYLIDPQAMLGGIGAVMMLDSWGIYGSAIYILYNDKCDRDVRKMLMLMRAVQLGHFCQSKLQAMASDQMRRVTLTDEEWADLDEKVCAQLDEFQRAA